MDENSASPAGAPSAPVARLGVPAPSGVRSRVTPEWLFVALIVPFGLAALVTLPRRLSLGPVSALAALTVLQLGLLLAAVVGLRRLPKRLIVSFMPYCGFLLVALLGVAWAPPGLEGIQNGLVYLLFGVAVVLGGSLSVFAPERTRTVVAGGMSSIFWITLGIVAIQLVVYGVPAMAGAYTNSDWYVTPRSIALVLLLPLGWYLGRWYSGSSRAAVMCLALLAGQAATLSRVATATGIALVTVMMILQARFRPARALTTLPVLAGLTIAAIALVLYYEPVRRRMFEGDTSLQIGGVGVNTSGRIELWTIVTTSARRRPLLGHGLGSAQELLGTQFSGDIAHPHNDYLRLWHDVGVLGAGLLLLAWIHWLVLLLRAWYRAEQRRAPPAADSLAAFLSLLGLMATMLVDNAIVYPFVMPALGILVGTGLGPSLVRQRTWTARARFARTHASAGGATLVGAGPRS